MKSAHTKVLTFHADALIARKREPLHHILFSSRTARRSRLPLIDGFFNEVPDDGAVVLHWFSEHPFVLHPRWQSLQSGSVGCGCSSHQCDDGKLVCRRPSGSYLSFIAIAVLRFLPGYSAQLRLAHRHVRRGERHRHALVRTRRCPAVISLELYSACWRSTVAFAAARNPEDGRSSRR